MIVVSSVNADSKIVMSSNLWRVCVVKPSVPLRYLMRAYDTEALGSSQISYMTSACTMFLYHVRVAAF